jgi:hypothetical protein
VFDAAISQGAAHRRLIDELLSFFRGRSQPMMAHLIESGQLTLEDLDKAKRALRRLARSVSEKQVHAPRVATAVREASPLDEGRELDMLRRLESISGLAKPIVLAASNSPLEPGVFGVWRRCVQAADPSRNATASSVCVAPGHARWNARPEASAVNTGMRRCR